MSNSAADAPTRWLAVDPVYVYCPPWRHDSAGIRVLHQLCDLLNRAGAPSWLVISNPAYGTFTNPQLMTPVLSQELADDHEAAGLKPIVVYSETVPGNPLGARRIVRYVLNFPGLLGGALSFSEGEFLLAYSVRIAEALGGCSTLFIPAADLEELDTFTAGSRQSMTPLVYAAKYRAFLGEPDFTGIPDAMEIHRGGTAGQARRQVLEELRAAPVLYCFENSTIATESILLGTPVVFVRSQFLWAVIADNELGEFGWCWSDDVSGLRRAQESLPLARARYLEVIDSLPARVAEFVVALGGVPEMPRGGRRIRVPKKAAFVSRHRVALGVQALTHLGPKASWRIARDFARRRRRVVVRDDRSETR